MIVCTYLICVFFCDTYYNTDIIICYICDCYEMTNSENNLKIQFAKSNNHAHSFISPPTPIEGLCKDSEP